MKDILGKLVVVEAAIRTIREQLQLTQMHRTASPIQDLNIGDLTDITPPSWTRAFRELHYSKPTGVGPYQSIIPGLVIGFPATFGNAIRVEQQPEIVENTVILYSLACWLTTPVDWLNLNFTIPLDIFTEDNAIYFTWKSALTPSQNIDVIIYQKNSTGFEQKVLVSTEYIPAMPWSNIVRIAAPPEDTVEFSVVISFDASIFHSISLYELRLLVDSPS